MNGQRDFLIGIVWAAWWLQSAHGLDSVAEELLRTVGPVRRLQKIARDEQYEFPRGFWAEIERKRRELSQ